MRGWLRACACALVLLAAGTGPTLAAESQPLTVFAAASLKESLDAAASAYQQATGQGVRVSYGASSALARQVEQGAPADVFISADTDWMDYLQARQLVDIGTRRNLLGNTLVLVAPANGDTRPVVLKPGVDLLPRLRERGRMALALTASVPAGKYAKASFTTLGIWPALQPRVSEAENVRAALMLVARGETPLGVVYGSDARAEPGVRVVAVFPEASHPPIVYPVARLARARHARAPDFIKWLASPAAAKLFRERGFTVR